MTAIRATTGTQMSSSTTSSVSLSEAIGNLQSGRIPASARSRNQTVELGLEGLAPRPEDTDVSAEEWRRFNTVSANALIVGSEELQARLWMAVWPTLKKPVCWTDGKHFWLPSGPVPTLIVQDIGRLDHLQQTRLLEWLHVKKDTRVLTTTRLPLSKSTRRTCSVPSAVGWSMMFAGFKSRCKMPWACASAKALPICRTMRATRSRGMPSAGISVAND